MNQNPKTSHMLQNPAVLRPVTTTLRSFGVREGMPDAIAEVQLRTLEYLRDRPQPADEKEWAALCVTIARNWQLDEKKKRKTAAKYCAGLCEEPDERGPREWSDETYDIADARGMLRELGEQLDAGEMPERADEILDCVQADMKLTEIAAELGISPSAVGKRLARIRELLRARLAALGITVMTAMLLVMAGGPAPPDRNEASLQLAA